MGLAFRLCARLDVKGPNLVKSINLEGVRVVGDPMEYAVKYDALGIDEIVYLDTVASLYRRNSLAEIVARSTDQVFCPVTVAGGIRSMEDAKALLRAGADKIAINTAAIERPELITEIAMKFGSNAMVLQIDAKRTSNGWEARTNGGREETGKDVIEWAQEGERLGAGEIFLTSIDREGTRSGIDGALINRACESVSIPIVYSGGIGNVAHISDTALAGASGIAMSGALHYGLFDLNNARKALSNSGTPVRMAA